jgi:hypothetical protein
MAPSGLTLLDTRQVGPQTASVTVHDRVGHATTATCAYTVV